MNANNKLKIFTFLAVLLVAIWFPAKAFSAQVAIVKSSDHPVFQEILSGISVMEGIDFVMYNMKGDKSTAPDILDEIKKSQPAAVVLIGPLATDKLALKLAPIPVVVCGTANTNSIKKSKKSKHIVALPLNPSPNDMLAAMSEVIHPASIGLIYSAGFSKFLPKIESWLTAHKTRLETVQINSTSDIESALEELKEKRIEALFMVPDKLNLSKKVTSSLISFAKDNRIPLFGLTPRIVKMGALFTIATDFLSIGSQVHSVLTQIVQQRKAPNSVEFEDTRKFTIVININTADKIKFKTKDYKRLMLYSQKSGYPVVVIK